MEFKGREQRAKCYEARDAYFECDKSNCDKLLKQFEAQCGAKWVEHFLRKRDYMKFKEKLEKGGLDSVDEVKIKQNS